MWRSASVPVPALTVMFTGCGSSSTLGTQPMPSFSHLPKAKFAALVVFLSLLQR
jgi:hypothetical protein